MRAHAPAIGKSILTCQKIPNKNLARMFRHSICTHRVFQKPAKRMSHKKYFGHQILSLLHTAEQMSDIRGTAL